LLMNAIFDAPKDRNATHYRRLTDRRDIFTLSAKELVTIEMGIAPEYVGIAATDQFGSPSREQLVAALHKNFHSSDYVPNLAAGQSAGLGLYGIVQSGLSIAMGVVPGECTMSAIFFPRTEFFAELKKSFRFSACFVEEKESLGQVRVPKRQN